MSKVSAGMISRHGRKPHHDYELVHLLILAAQSPAERSVLDHCDSGHHSLQNPPALLAKLQ
jgi:hypothetical protein